MNPVAQTRYPRTLENGRNAKEYESVSDIGHQRSNWASVVFSFSWEWMHG